MPIEQFAPELERILSLDQEVEILGAGYGSQSNPAEGPIWWKEAGYLIFSDIGNDRRLKWSPAEGVTVVKELNGKANGLTRDPQGRLVACESGMRRITRQETSGKITVVADKYEGKRLNFPNDVIVKSDGSVYFTDPWTVPWEPNPAWDQPCRGVYRVSPDFKKIDRLVDDFTLPNGLAFSPDESVLYINDSIESHIRVFDVQSDGTLKNDRLFCELKGEGAGTPDGMKLDVEGNVYCTGPKGLWIMDSTGKHLGTVDFMQYAGHQQTTNCAWGGDDLKTLFVTTTDSLARIQCKIAGIPVPR
jgi:gluconolactonase